MNAKRITIFCGHYGSGKTNVAVNFALKLKQVRDEVSVLDLDIVNPYFRTKDSLEDLKAAGIRLIASQYANSNVDIPALPQDMYSITDNQNVNAVVDVGGDDRGALALGRLAPKIREENNFEMLMVINCYRPLTRTADEVMEVMREIEEACSIKFTGLVNNSNLGRDTTVEDILASKEYAERVSQKSGLPIVLTSVREDFFDEIEGKMPNVFALNLQKNLLIN